MRNGMKECVTSRDLRDFAGECEGGQKPLAGKMGVGLEEHQLNHPVDPFVISSSEAVRRCNNSGLAHPLSEHSPHCNEGARTLCEQWRGITGCYHRAQQHTVLT